MKMFFGCCFNQKSTFYRVMMTLFIIPVVSLCFVDGYDRAYCSPISAKKNERTRQRRSTFDSEPKTRIDRTPAMVDVRLLRGGSAFVGCKCIQMWDVRNNVNKGLMSVWNLRRAHRNGDGPDPYSQENRRFWAHNGGFYSENRCFWAKKGLWVLPGRALPGGWRWRAKTKFLRKKGVSGPLGFRGSGTRREPEIRQKRKVNIF